MRNIAGSPVEGADFFGRDEAIRSLWELLDAHDVLLLGPRRIGKTSLARRFMADVRQRGWSAIEVNVASCRDEAAFVDKLAGTIKAAAGSWTGALLDRAMALLDRVDKVRLPGGGGFDLAAREESWEAVASDALALLAARPGRTLVYIDELPIFLFNMMRFDPKTGEARVRRFLDWFRNDARGATRGAGGLHWLVSGSVGLDTLVQNHGMADTINTLKQRLLEPYGEPEALAFLDAL
ncbi:ATP-binding protein, partial [Azospirillum sp. RWY-5-1]